MVRLYPAQEIIDLGESSGQAQFVNLIEDDAISDGVAAGPDGTAK
jgi:hypothetical protein